MLGEFIDTQLAQFDNVDELKVTLAALRLLGQKQSATAMISEAELLRHAAVRDGLRMPAIQLRPALQLAVARGALLVTSDGDDARYLLNTPESRAAIESLDAARTHLSARRDVAGTLTRVGREIARLEGLEAYAPTPDDAQRVEDWLARGYTEHELLAAARTTLLHPRARNAPSRKLAHIAKALTQKSPETPSDYFDVIVSRKRPASEEIVNLRLRLGHEPSPREFEATRAAVAIYGLRATIDAFGRLIQDGKLDADALLPLLAESESAALAQAKSQAGRDDSLREAIRLYESAFAAPPTGLIANEIKLALADAPDLALWRSTFDYATRNNKRSWAYVKRLLLNPSPDIFMPEPVNDVARGAFEMYKKRVNRALDTNVAAEINTVAVEIADAVAWKRAFDVAAAANALRWDYIKSVLTSKDKSKPEKKADGKRQPARTGRGGTYTRPQVSYTDEQRKAAEERARRALEGQDDD